LVRKTIINSTNKIVDLAKDTLVYGSADFLQKAIGFLLLPIYTRFLTPSDYGILAMLVIISALFTPIASLGLPNAIFREFSIKSNDRNEILGTGFIAIIISSSLLLIITLYIADIISYGLIGDANSKIVFYVKITLISSFFSCLLTIPQILLRAKRRAKLTSLLNIIQFSLSLSFTIIFVIIFKMKIMGVIYGTLLSVIISTFINYFMIGKDLRLYFNLSKLKKMLYYGLPYVPARIQGFGMLYFGQYLVNNQLGLAEAGLYSIALKICMPFHLIIQAVQKAWVPLKFQIYSKEKNPTDTISYIIKNYIIIVCFIWIMVALWGEGLINITVPSEYRNAGALIPFVALIPLSNSLFYSFSSGFGITDNTKHLPLVNFFGLISIITFSMLLVDNYGTKGVAISTAISWLVMAKGIHYFSQKQYQINYNIIFLLKIILGTISLYIISYSFPKYFAMNYYFISLFTTLLCIMIGKILLNRVTNN